MKQNDRKRRRIILRLAAATFAALLSTVSLRAGDVDATNQTEQLAAGQMPYFDAVSDPLEGFNRCSWTVNNWLFRGFFYPLSVGYNKVAPKPVRKHVYNVGHNLTYPVRLVNNCLQGKWHGAWEETKRFGVNTTVGVAGIFDPATKWNIGESEEDFGQTLGRWGSGPGFYLMIPIIGPSNGRDAVGRIVDWPLDLCFWIGQAADGDVFPVTFWSKDDELWPSALRPGFAFNSFSGDAPDFKRQLDSMVDPYQALRTLYSLNRERLIIDFLPRYDESSRPDPTLGAVFFKPVTPKFANQAATYKVRVPATGKKLAYSCWMQKKPAPLVCYLPGLGSYRLDRSTLAYADLMYRHGYSVVAFSNPFQKEFMEHGSTMAIPGYGPADCDDVVAALKLVLADLRKRKGEKITGTSLTGVSHGGYFTLMIAAREAAGQLDGLSFDRYVAVNPPASLVRALDGLDDLFKAPLAWPAAERRQHMEETIYKALYFAEQAREASDDNTKAFTENGLNVSGSLPLSREESRFLIGLAFRYTLMSAIVDSQRRENLGVLKVDPDKFVRQRSYREIRQISYAEYMDRFMVPYLIKNGRGTDREQLLAATDLTQGTGFLTNNAKVRVQICEDDFLLKPTDIEWFRTTFGTNLTAYPVGGHLGNLHVPAVQEALVRLFPVTIP
jgi:ABC-type transporter lipoprotein component MlaA